MCTLRQSDTPVLFLKSSIFLLVEVSDGEMRVVNLIQYDHPFLVATTIGLFIARLARCDQLAVSCRTTDLDVTAAFRRTTDLDVTAALGRSAGNIAWIVRERNCFLVAVVSQRLGPVSRLALAVVHGDEKCVAR